MEEIKVSVVIPYFNNEKEILRALQSVIKQTYTNFEIIVVDDGSKDNSHSLVEDFIQRNQGVKIKHLSQKNSGPSSARNLGVTHASGVYLAFLDSDDAWYPDKLECQMKILKEINYNVSVIGSRYDVVTGSDFMEENYIPKVGFTRMKKISFTKMLLRNYIYTSACVINRDDFINAGGFNINQKYSEDYALLLRLSHGKGALLIEKALFCMFKKPFGESGLSSNLKQMEFGELSNYHSLYKERKISIVTLLLVSGFSYLKYILRKLKCMSKK